MRKDVINKSATLGSTSDLTVYAPIMEGFIGSLDAVSYKTRVKRVLNTLHLGRRSSHEYDLFRAMSDAVERVGRIHSIRIAILERDHPQGRDHVMLAVTFDGSWESYIRTIWQKVSNSLDLIFCNTEEYVCGGTSSFEEWDHWLRGRQAESSFFYSPPGLTYEDTQYLAVHERFSRGILDADERDRDTTALQLASAEAITHSVAQLGIHPHGIPGATAGSDTAKVQARTLLEYFRQGVRSLAALYRLSDWYLPGTPDGTILHRAAAELLQGFYADVVETKETDTYFSALIDRAEDRFGDALGWLRDTPYTPREAPPPPKTLGLEDKDLKDVQAGILDPVQGVSEGCLCFLRCENAAALGQLLAELRATSHGDASLAEAALCTTISLTAQAFYLAGYSDDEVGQLPAEFVQGMERRAGLLGDVRQNHPRRWRQPALNGHLKLETLNETEDAKEQRIDLAQVHVVLQVRSHRGSDKMSAAPDRQAIVSYLTEVLKSCNGTALLGMQWTHVLRKSDGKPVDHFGYLDGDGVSSQPAYEEGNTRKFYPNLVHAGEVLRGYANAADKAPGDDAHEMVKLQRNGSFLVVRKLRQHVDRLESAIVAAMAQNGVAENQKVETRLLMLGKMMGRWHGDDSSKAGEALAKGPVSIDPNDFSYRSDADGEKCPFHAHIRLANPRVDPLLHGQPEGARPPRIVRRSMSYGSAVTDKASMAEPRGMLFMAYNASIGEQYEVIQRWLTGGNSSGGYSGESDPLLGVADVGYQRCFKFLDRNRVVRVPLDGTPELGADPQALVELEWGAYLFTPGLAALEAISKRATELKKPRLSWSVAQGRKEITRLRDIEATQGHNAALLAWKYVLEDPELSADYTSASVWAAIRADHGGVLKTPFGVLVGSRDLVDRVTKDENNLTITAFLPRMRRSFGELYLGLDGGQPDQRYEKEAQDANAAVIALAAPIQKYVATCAAATTAVLKAVDKWVQDAAERALENEEPNWELTLDAREIIDAVLADLCEQFFGLSERGGYLKRGSAIWDDTGNATPRYPGHFMAPSRYVFQPHPGPDVERIASAQGQALSRAMTAYLADPKIGPFITAPVARAVLDSAAAKADPSYAARTLAGILMGFVPTLDGNMRRILVEWAREGTLWALRTGNLRDTKKATCSLRESLFHTMQLRAAPEQLWRTAVTTHQLGDRPHAVDLRPGDVVVAGLISANHEGLECGNSELFPAFGGERTTAVQVPPGQARHACPGQGPAMAVLEGFLRGLMTCPHPLRPGPTGLTFLIRGQVEIPLQYERLEAFKPKSGLFKAVNSIPTIAVGDSWLTKVPAFGKNTSLMWELVQIGLDPGEKEEVTGKDKIWLTDIGNRLSQIADDDHLNKFKIRLETELNAPRDIKVILLDGGGNDLVHPKETPSQSSLFAILKEVQALTTAGKDVIKENSALNKFIDQVKRDYKKICDFMIDAQKPYAREIPILIHGYSYPTVSGIPAIKNRPDRKFGPWLKPVFEEAGFDSDLGKRNQVMIHLIDALNEAITEVAGTYQNRVHYINLRETFKNHDPNYDGALPQYYEKYWSNELHPSKLGCELNAAKYWEKLKCLGIIADLATKSAEQ